MNCNPSERESGAYQEVHRRALTCHRRGVRSLEDGVARELRYDRQKEGREQQPDIFANHSEGMKRVYSCKALTIERKISLPIEELRPEVLEAQRSGRELVLSVYNLADGTEKDI